MIGSRLLAGALAAVALVMPAAALQAANGARLDPQNLIADDIEAEAINAYRRAAAVQPFRGHDIVIVDYRLPSNVKRLYIVDLFTGGVESHYVAHGRGSDPDHTQHALRFSNVAMTGMSSVGAYRGLDRYQSPNHGPALRLRGLDGTNSDAYDRLIVFHTADYFDPEHGRYGRSCGCFVVTREDMARVYDVIADGGFLYAGPARLNDGAVTLARDCNPACGNVCPSQPIVADARPSHAPIRIASISAPAASDAPPLARPPRPVAPRPAPIVPAVLPVAVAVLVPTPKAKPKLPSETPPVAVAMIAPRPKPALDVPPPAAPAENPATPVPLAKPALEAAPPDAVVSATPIPQSKPALDVAPATLASDIPLPRPKPDSIAAPTLVAEATIPQPLPKPAVLTEASHGTAGVPVPHPKPALPRRVADAG